MLSDRVANKLTKIYHFLLQFSANLNHPGFMGTIRKGCHHININLLVKWRSPCNKSVNADYISCGVITLRLGGLQICIIKKLTKCIENAGDFNISN